MRNNAEGHCVQMNKLNNTCKMSQVVLFIWALLGMASVDLCTLKVLKMSSAFAIYHHVCTSLCMTIERVKCGLGGV